MSLSFLFPLSHELQANFILITPLETGPTVYYSILDILYLLNIMDTSFTPNPVSFSAYIAISSTCTWSLNFTVLYGSALVLHYFFFQYAVIYLGSHPIPWLWILSLLISFSCISLSYLCSNPQVYISKPLLISEANVASYLFSLKTVCIRVSLYQLSSISSSQFFKVKLFSLSITISWTIPAIS